MGLGPAIATGAGAFCSGFLVAAGTRKAVAPEALELALQRLLRCSGPQAVAGRACLVIAEITAGFALGVPRLRVPATVAVLLLCVLFLSAAASAHLRQMTVLCGCLGGSVLNRRLGLGTVPLILALAASALAVAFFETTRPDIRQTLPAACLGVIAVSGLLVALERKAYLRTSAVTS